MESIYLIVVISVAVPLLLKHFLNYRRTNQTLPPGPPTFPIIGNFLWIGKSLGQLLPIIRNLHAEYGPMITLHIGHRPAIFIADRSLAHQTLVQNGAVFADRPKAVATRNIFTSDQRIISSAHYGPTWRILRRNLTSEILHPSRVKSYSHARNWVLQILRNRLVSVSKSGSPVSALEEFQYVMFCLLVFMCFGDKLDQSQVKEIEKVGRAMLMSVSNSNALNFWPRVTKIVFRRRWEELLQLRRDQEDVLIPLIRARKKINEVRKQNMAKEDCQKEKDEHGLCYVDTLFDLQLPDEKRKLTEEEMVSLCNEFLNAGTDSTSTALEWIMANLVKYPHIQEKLFMEMKTRMGDEKAEEVKEEDLERMPYLKAIVMEGLRRHPPGHVVLPHAVTENMKLAGHIIPKNAVINFMVADMGLDPKVWEDPMAFKPERFEGEVVDITGSKEIKMMPFGVGRRICPGYGLAILHLEYFVANLVWTFEWKAVDGEEVELSEKQCFTIVMEKPLQANLFPRVRK